MSDAASYRFAPRREHGPLGLSSSQAAALAGSAVLALIVVLGARQPLVGLCLMALGAAVAFTPIAGQPAVSWLRTIIAYRVGRRDAIAPLVHGGITFAATGITVPRPAGAVRFQLPNSGRLRIRPVASDLGEIGVAELSGTRSSSVTFALGGPRFGLVETEVQARAIGSWGQLLGALARDGARPQRLQLTERLVPDGLAQQWRFLAGLGSVAGVEARATYRAGLEAIAGRAVRHEVLLTVTLRSNRDPQMIVTECRRLSEVLRAAGFPAHPLSAASLRETISSMLDPERSRHRGTVDGEPSSEDASERQAGAPSWRAEWGSIRTESGIHAVFEATGLPRQPVGPEWAWPLVLAEQPVENRTLALHLELTAPEVAIRRAERSAIALESDEAMRARWGFRSGARQAQAHDAALDREAELASGFADARFALLVTVSATNDEALAASARALISQGAQSHTELRRVFGRQAEALVATLPLGAMRLSGGRR